MEYSHLHETVGFLLVKFIFYVVEIHCGVNAFDQEKTASSLKRPTRDISIWKREHWFRLKVLQIHDDSDTGFL